jgi:FdhE protein
LTGTRATCGSPSDLIGNFAKNQDQEQTVSTNGIKVAALVRSTALSPEYAAITPLFIALYEFIGDHEEHTGINITLPAEIRENSTDKCFPLLSASMITINDVTLTAFLLGIILILGQQGKAGDEALERIAKSLSSGSIDLQLLILAILERRRGPLDDAAVALEVPPPLLEYIFEIPLKTALERFSTDIHPELFPDWQGSTCPVCGARPGMSELSGEEGRRMLSCSACFFLWPFKRLKCPSCGCEDPEKLSYFTAGDGATRADTCRACSRYIKTRDSRKGGNEVPLDIEDLLTIHLDLLASREGFERGK